MRILNKILIPATLVAVAVVAGIFAFMPIEKASTVHSSLTSTIDSEINAQDRFVYFSKNFTTFDQDSTPGTTILKIDSGETVTVYAVVTATRNSAFAAGGNGGILECGVVSGSNDITTNATHGTAATSNGGTSVRNGSLTITNGADIMFGSSGGAASTIGGICALMLQIDSGNG